MRNKFFLIERKHMQEFLTNLPLGAGSTLLAPVVPRTLQIFVEQAAARWKCRVSNAEEREPDSTETYAKDALQCLLITNLKLQEYDQDRTNFIARAVHDFRAPLMAAGVTAASFWRSPGTDERPTIRAGAANST